jgi:hypothetical protein
LKDYELFDPTKLGRYSVFRVWYEYPGQEPGEKLFIVLKHGKKTTTAYCMCIKATSRLERFKTDDDLRKACIFYKGKTLPFFPIDTMIDPSNYIPMLHETLAKEAKHGRYRVEGKMPDTFHNSLVEAIKCHPNIEPKNKKILLVHIDEEL